MLLIIGFLTFVIGLIADMINANRKILQDVQYHIKRMEYDMMCTPGTLEGTEDIGDHKADERNGAAKGD